MSYKYVCWRKFFVLVCSKKPGLILSYIFDVVEPYFPDRCVRQLGYIQGIPDEPYRPDHASRPAKATQYVVSFSVTNLRQIWKSNLGWYLPDKFAHPLATIPFASTLDYISWFLSISHPIIVNPNLRGNTSDEMLSNLMGVMEPVADKGISLLNGRLCCPLCSICMCSIRKT